MHSACTEFRIIYLCCLALHHFWRGEQREVQWTISCEVFSLTPLTSLPPFLSQLHLQFFPIFSLPIFLPFTCCALHLYTFVLKIFRVSLTLCSFNIEMPGNAHNRARWSRSRSSVEPLCISSILLLRFFFVCHIMAISCHSVSSNVPCLASNHLDVHAERRTYSDE